MRNMPFWGALLAAGVVLSAAPAAACKRKSDGARRQTAEAPPRDVAPRVRLLETLQGSPDVLKVPKDAKRDATAGVFI